MEQQTKTSASSEPARPYPDFSRCHARTRDRKQCRLRAIDTATGLCSRHAARAGEIPDNLQDSVNLYEAIFAPEQPILGTVEDINAVLSNIVILVAEGRISSRRAAVITYALSLLLRSVVAMERKAANEPPEIIWDAPRSKYDEPPSSPPPGANSYANTNTSASTEPSVPRQATAQESFDAVERYAQLRT